MSKIKKIWAREILDSRATPTVEAACQLESGEVALFSVPSGASTGSHEALELRDNDEKRYWGKGVLKAVKNINEIIGPSLMIAGVEAEEQLEIDKRLIEIDGMENKSRLGANSTLAVSGVIARVAAMAQKMTLYDWINKLMKMMKTETGLDIPTPVFNMINGGLHGAGNLDFQEFFVIPASTKNIDEGLQMGVEIYMAVGQNLAHRGAIHSVGDEGGYAPNLFTNADALEILVEGIKQTSYQMGRDVFLGLDVAAATFFKDGVYSIRDKSAPLNEDAMISYYEDLNNLYHLAILEDPLNEDAWEGWKKLRDKLGEQMAIVGDDLLATNVKRLERAVAAQSCNAVLIKPNQRGTIMETLEVIKKTREAKWKVIVSHRSGETNDSFIADFAVGVGADYVKFGAPARGERVAKYNRLKAIEIELKYRSKNEASRS